MIALNRKLRKVGIMKKRKYDWGYALAWVVGELFPTLIGLGGMGYLVYLMFERI